ncbi:hypothetical protein RBU49_09655 [Clostridium sp. MB40-C1]|uniref:hypothetical protein n=1 Tax=Clostridium sp. MB40-C1 TaxID=3070996 RepID=UPI0027E19D65|nr:hypothetical protein [Clostridium sp. MB40-C1]WMJ79157.1 hypothetical protein RBU49_09655 [Clostridium sp. MB40-C1]
MFQKELFYGIEELKDLVKKRNLEEQKLSKYINPNKKIIKVIVLICIFIYPVIMTLNSEYKGITSVINFTTNKNIKENNVIMGANMLLMVWTLIAIVLLLYQVLKSVIFRNKIYNFRKSINVIMKSIDELGQIYEVPMTYMNEGALEYFSRCLKENRADNLRECVNYYINETYMNNIINVVKR